MDRINHASAAADKFGAGKDGFDDGDPADPSSGTVVNEDFLDGVQEELIGVIETAGLTPSNADYTQLLQALDLLFGTTKVVGMTAADFLPEPSQVMLTSDAGLGTLTNPRACCFNDTGLRLFQVNSTDNKVYQYDLSTPWDISTATYSSITWDTSTQITGSAHGIAFRPTGLSFYVGDTVNNDIYQYTCTTAFDLTSGVSYASKTLDADTEMSQARTLQFSADGSILWISSSTEDTVYEYTLGTDWDLSTASYASRSVDLTTGPEVLMAGLWSSDGLRLLAVGHESGGDLEYRQWDATVAFDITTLSAGAAKVTNSTYSGFINGIGHTPDTGRLIINFLTDDDAKSFSFNHLVRGI